MPPLYPVFLRLSGRPVTIVGGGRVALRKTRGLVAAGAVVTVVAPEFAPGLKALPVGLVNEPWRIAHLRGAVLVFAATDDSAVNRNVARAARARGIPVCTVDDAEECDFQVPAVSRRAGIAVAVSTGGAAPALAAELRRGIDRILARGAAKLAARQRNRLSPPRGRRDNRPRRATLR